MTLPSCGITLASALTYADCSHRLPPLRSKTMAYSPTTTSVFTRFARTPVVPTTYAIPGAPLAGRILLSTIFILSGLTKFTDWNGTANYMAAHGLTLIPVLLPIAALVEIAGGLAI